MQSIIIPDIGRLPQTPTEAASFIWNQQESLNALAHPDGRGTIEAGRTLSREALNELAFDYHLALASEVAENFENSFYKHWSAEAKQGRRFELIHPGKESGEGTAQNVLVEITDITFFTVSLLHILGMTEAEWIAIWGSKATWEGVYGHPANKSDLKAITRLSLDLLTAAGNKPFNHPAGRKEIGMTLAKLCQASGLGWERILSLYAQKLVKNYERQLRGRKQVGDTLAEEENATVRG